jgi:phage host-nuclease inhibitor protein Gam
MSEAYTFFKDSFEQTPAPYSSLPSPPMLSTPSTLSNILFPDFENVKMPIPHDSDALADASNPTDGTPAPSFIINDPSKASWAIARILETEAGIAQRTSLAESYKARIDQWLTSANKQDNDSISYLSFLLEPYVKDEVAKLYKSRTLSLPTGTASLRKLPDRLEITDSSTALAYCEAEHPEAVIIKKELDKSILKDLILKQAEPIPGVEAELGPDKLYVKPLKLKAA